MAEVRIAEVYNPLIFDPGVQEAAIENNAFIQSGVMVRDNRIDAMASGPGNVGEIPFYFGLANPQSDGTNEPNYTTDDPAVTSTPADIQGEKQVYMSAHKHQSWSTMDLARELGLQDPAMAIINRIGQYWAVDSQHRVVQSLLGVLADNIANDSGDMVNAIASETIAGQSAATRISADAILDTAATMGDKARNLAAIAMHSVQLFELKKQNLIDYIPNARGEVVIPTYLNYRVVEDDNMPVRAGTTDGFVYTVMLVGAGAVAFGVGNPPVPSEIERIQAAGNGGGQDVIHSRQTTIEHPYGFSFNTAGIAGQSPTYAELALAANWNRVYQYRKNVNVAFLTCN